MSGNEDGNEDTHRFPGNEGNEDTHRFPEAIRTPTLTEELTPWA